MTATHYTGVYGTLTVDLGATALAEFSLKLDRSAATHARSGKHTDLQVPGKLVATGTITRILIDKVFLDHAQDGTLFDLVGKVDDGATPTPNTITITAGNCFLTADEFKFSDANNISSEPMTFAVSDADTDLVIAESP